MSMPHNFSDDPNSFSGPPANTSSGTVILVAIAIVCGTLMLICGGVIFGVVMTVRQAQQDFEIVMDDIEWQEVPDPSTLQEFSGFVASGRYSEAIESINSGLESAPDSAFLHNNKAWLLATCPDDAVRDGELAVEHATTACELTEWSNFAFVDTLAAAYAEAGDFESAVQWQEEAISLGGGAYSQDFQKRLRLFKAGKPYREGVPPYEGMIDEPPTGFPPALPPAEPEPIDVPVDEPTETEIADKQQLCAGLPNPHESLAAGLRAVRGSPDPAHSSDRRSPRTAQRVAIRETFGQQLRRGRETCAERAPRTHQSTG
jgi:hypothetical protein